MVLQMALHKGVKQANKSRDKNLVTLRMLGVDSTRRVLAVPSQHPSPTLLSKLPIPSSPKPKQEPPHLGPACDSDGSV